MILPDDLIDRSPRSRIVLFVLDGLGGLPHPKTGKTELETAHTPHLDALAARSSLGRHTPVAAGVTPGSGPAHLALFGYDPLRYLVGRGALSALGVGCDLGVGDLAIRLNLASLDAGGRVLDRRAGRPSDEEARGAVRRLAEGVRLPDDVRFELLHEKEHRAVLVLRGEGLHDGLSDTDPQREGVPPLDPAPLVPEAARAATLLASFIRQAQVILADEPRIHGVLARGYARFEGLPSFESRFGLRGAAWAKYPMYRGVARLVGMQVPGVPASDDEALRLLASHFGAYEFHFLHVKGPDARGEDGDFDGKVAAIETADAMVESLVDLNPDVLVVTGDHSTPAAVGAHTWHTVPLLVHSKWARPTASAFGEGACRGGDLGHVRGMDVMTLALAHAGRLRKFGA
jgi:2,3-bisphosphoglycerate-independent phosphoglycerate mutase